MSARPRLALESNTPSPAASPATAMAVAAGDDTAPGITEAVLRALRTATPSTAFESMTISQRADSRAQEG